MEQLHYIDTKYKPNKHELIAKFYVEPNKVSFKIAAENVARESSVGTWTSLSTMNKVT